MQQIAHVSETTTDHDSEIMNADSTIEVVRVNDRMMGGRNMMGFGNTMMGGYGPLVGLTWIALITFLISGIYFFIKRANKK